MRARPTALVVGVALFFLWMGIGALAAPERVLALFGVAVETADGRSEVRAVYGGFGVAMAALLLATWRRPTLRDGVLVCLAIAVAGMAGGRVVSAMIDGTPGPWPSVFFVVELALAVALVAALRRAPR
jgi:hypothetical protein